MESTKEIEVTANGTSNSNVDYSQYKDTPEAVFAIANQFFNKKQFEEGLSVIEKGIELAVKKYGSEECIELAKFYDKYGEGLIRKQLENDEILALPKETFEAEANHLQHKKDHQEDNSNNNEEEEAQEPEDEQIIYENLMVANTLYVSFLKDFDLKSPSSLSKDIIKYYLQLADNYMLFGELETVKSDYAQAFSYYSKAAALFIKYDEKYSRSLAECYFKQASVLDYDPKKCLLSFFKTKVIMEYHLSKKVGAHPKGKDISFDINSMDLELMEIKEESPRVYINRACVESEPMRQLAKEEEEIGNLVDIINDLYLRIEDVITELKEYDRYMTEKKNLTAKTEFTENYDKEKVIDISSTLVKKKRPRSPIETTGENDVIEKGVKVKKTESNGDKEDDLNK